MPEPATRAELRAFLADRGVSPDRSEEIASHLDESVAARLEAGAGPVEAEVGAVRALGDAAALASGLVPRPEQDPLAEKIAAGLLLTPLLIVPELMGGSAMPLLMHRAAAVLAGAAFLFFLSRAVRGTAVRARPLLRATVGAWLLGSLALSIVLVDARSVGGLGRYPRADIRQAHASWTASGAHSRRRMYELLIGFRTKGGVDQWLTSRAERPFERRALSNQLWAMHPYRGTPEEHRLHGFAQLPILTPATYKAAWTGAPLRLASDSTERYARTADDEVHAMERALRRGWWMQLPMFLAYSAPIAPVGFALLLGLSSGLAAMRRRLDRASVRLRRA